MEKESVWLPAVRRGLAILSVIAIGWLAFEIWATLGLPRPAGLSAIDQIEFRWIAPAVAWPWGASLAGDDLGAVLAGRARIATAHAAVVLATTSWAVLLPAATLFTRTRRGWRQVGAVAAASVALVCLACLEQGSAAEQPPPSLGALRLLRLSLTTMTAVIHIAIVGGALRAAWARRLADAGAIERTEFATSSDGWASQFRGLVSEECRRIMGARPMTAPVEGDARRKPEADPLEACQDLRVPEKRTSAGEPFVAFRAGDLTGLALSGGGIRSATFALGVLQGLHRVGMLNKFDYLSTVSGGGYIGSFWSNWLARRELLDKAGTNGTSGDFPSNLDPRPPREDAESHQVRHLREFGNFLAPRLGLFEVETWTAVVAVVSGLIPAVLTALSLIGVALIAWLVTTVPLSGVSPWPGVLVMLVVTALVLVHFERRWQLVKLPAKDPDPARQAARRRDFRMNVGFGAAAVVLAAGLALEIPDEPLASEPTTAETRESVTAEGEPPPRGLRELVNRVGTALVPGQASWCAQVEHPRRPLVRLNGCWREVREDSSAWWTLAGLSGRSRDYWFASPALFTYPLIWLLTGVLLLLVRHGHALVPSYGHAAWVPPLDRVIMRILGLGLFWAGVVVLWHIAIALDRIVETAILSAASAGGFALLRNWLTRVGQAPAGQGRTSALKEALPPLLAYLTLILAAAAVGQLLVWLCGWNWYRWWAAFTGMALILVGGLFIDPGLFGLHAFYRGRISRAYAGANNLASRETALDNRVSEPREGDDPLLTSLPVRPLHLICCTANDLSGDAVGTLGRNARSAVLSRYGLSVGPYAGVTPGLTLGAAVTASAAAFNSNMGDVSARFGPAVTFLMTALNLRLGLWVRHPEAEPALPRRWPGLLLYREFFGLTSASGEMEGQEIPSHLRDLHLSDGGHFENLGLYELVRRHCRYILVCDSGADPTVAFDDLGRAMRRVRQDFGVDISIDVEALRPDEKGLSTQHIAVGRIHYSPTDAGILLYVKPTVTGDEPADVLQFKRRNHDFPHEGTGDQFYDEAQWESYRRLGLHVADTIFHFVPPAANPASGASVVPGVQLEGDETVGNRYGQEHEDVQERGSEVTADYVFAEAAHRWGPTPPGLGDRVLEMTRRVAEFETELKATGGPALVAEVFPELRFVPGVAEPTPDPSLAGAELVTLLRVTQLLEDVWSACELDRWWAHPLNMGWVNFFARWVTAPTFRFWWPVMGPMYSKGFRDFLDERFPLPESRTRTDECTGLPWQGTVRRVPDEQVQPPTGLAKEWWQYRSAQACPWLAAEHGPSTYLENIVHLRRGDTTVPLQSGLLAVWLDGKAALWTSDDFFVPPSLWGASIGWHFLDGVLNHLALDSTRKFVYVAVRRDPDVGGHRIALDDTRAFVDQYRKIGFRQVLDAESGPNRDTVHPLLQARGLVDGPRRGTRSGRHVDALLELDLDSWVARRGAEATKRARAGEDTTTARRLVEGEGAP